MKRNKYRNIRCEVDGIKFASKKEGNYYLYLKNLKETGAIKDFQCQPIFRFPQGIKYIADFRITHLNGKVVIWDIKSPITKKNPVYRLKFKLLKYHYPEVNFEEI